MVRRLWRKGMGSNHRRPPLQGGALPLSYPCVLVLVFICIFLELYLTAVSDCRLSDVSRRAPATGWARDGKRRQAVLLKQALASRLHRSMRPTSGHRRYLPWRIIALLDTPRLRLSRDCDVKERPRSGPGASPFMASLRGPVWIFCGWALCWRRIRSDYSALSSFEDMRPRVKAPFWRRAGPR